MVERSRADTRATGRAGRNLRRLADTFHNAVREDWLKLWRAGADGFVLTTVRRTRAAGDAAMIGRRRYGFRHSPLQAEQAVLGLILDPNAFGD